MKKIDIFFNAFDQVLDLINESIIHNSLKNAIVFGNKKYSYKEFDTITDRIASYIRNVLKIPEDSIIAIKMQRSDLAIVSINFYLESNLLILANREN